MTNIKSQYLENQRAAIIKGNGDHVHKIGLFLSGSDPILPLLLRKEWKRLEIAHGHPGTALQRSTSEWCLHLL